MGDGVVVGATGFARPATSRPLYDEALRVAETRRASISACSAG